MNLKGFREKYPMYNHLSDEKVAKNLHRDFYSHMDWNDFVYKLEYVPEAEQPKLEEALKPEAPATGPARGTSTLKPEKSERDKQYDKLKEDLKRAELPEPATKTKALKRGGKKVVRNFLDFMQMQEEVQQKYKGVTTPIEQRAAELEKQPEINFYSAINPAFAQTEESLNKKIKEYKTRKKEILQKLEDFKPELDPIFYSGEGLQKYSNDFVEMIPQVASMIGLSLTIGPASSSTFMATQIAGPQYRQLVDSGVPEDRAAIAAMINAFTQAPMEQIGIGKALTATAGKKIVGAMLTEFITETAQKNPELATNIWAQTEGTAEEKVAQFMEQWIPAMKEGMYEGSLAAFMGGGTASVSAGINKAAEKMQKAQDPQVVTEDAEQFEPTKEQLDAVEVEVEAIREKTGDKLLIKQKASDAVQDIDERIDMFSKIMDCISG